MALTLMLFTLGPFWVGCHSLAERSPEMIYEVAYSEELGAPSPKEWNAENRSKTRRLTFQSIRGAVISVEALTNTRVEVRGAQVLGVDVQQALPSPGVPTENDYVFVELVVDDAVRARVDELRTRYPDALLASVTGNRTKAIAPLANWDPSTGLPGGVFRSRQEAEKAYAWAGSRVRYQTLSAEDRETAAALNGRLVEIAVWSAKCDRKYLTDLGEGLLESVLKLPDVMDRMNRADCGSKPSLFSP